MLHFEDNLTVLILLVFLCITFLQSALDKLIDWKGNLGWLKGHFEKSFLKNTVPFLLVTIIIMEVISGVLGIWGIMDIVHYKKPNIALNAAVVSCLTLLMLLFGQRVAKDYDGARTIVIYLVPAVLLLFFLEMSMW
ncbi:DoxX family protein [Flavobacteriaceae bacterium]|nr:DoxX family protein [Flavobacteriaceae bacterium]